MSDLLKSIEGGVLTLTINRPEAHNTMNAGLSGLLIDALEQNKDNPDVRCIVVTGAGRVFCAGGDVGDQASGALHGDEKDPAVRHAALVKMIREGSDLFGMLHTIPKPTLAIMPGAAAGAGLALALACDFRFCLDTAKLTSAFGRIGLSCDSGLSYFLPRIVGMAKARELCFNSEVVTGRDAYEIGLVTKVASSDSFAEEARAYADQLASLPTVAIGYMKETMNAADHKSLDEVLDLESEYVVRSMSTEDHKRAAAAFMKKERVVFEGR